MPARFFLPLCAAFLANLSGLGAEQTRPNILIITTDDQGYADLSCMGSKEIRTPNLDELARRGVLCKAFYSNSPVCSPSRAALLTGLFPAHAGVRVILGSAHDTEGLPAGLPTIASVLGANGYATFLSGKWHLGLSAGSRPEDHGFQHAFGFLGGCLDYYSHLYYWSGSNPVHDLQEDGHEVWHGGEYLTGLITKKAIASIQEALAEKKPFFGYVAYNAPHYPLLAPTEYIEKFKNLPPDRQMMAAMLAAVDDGVGEILATLEKRGVLDNTFVFFMSDNGPSRESRNWLNGDTGEFFGGHADPWRGSKFTLWEGGIRVPAIFSWPKGIPAGREISEPMMAMDVFPTVMKIAGVKSDRPVDGIDILPLLRGAKPSEARTFHWEFKKDTAIRRGDWKLILQGGKKPLLLNLAKDPGEKRDFTAENPSLAKSLADEAMAWRKEVAGD